MDVRLLDILGTEAAKILRQDKKTSDIPIIFVTASIFPAIEGVMEEAKSMTNSAFMGKPINTRTFAKEISQYLR